MKIHGLDFKGEVVGFQFIAENEQEKNLLRCLIGLKAEECDNFEDSPGVMFLSPALPWSNLEDRPTPPDANVCSADHQRERV